MAPMLHNRSGLGAVFRKARLLNMCDFYAWVGVSDIPPQMCFRKLWPFCVCVFSLLCICVQSLAQQPSLWPQLRVWGICFVLRAKALSHDLQLTHHTAAISLCVCAHVIMSIFFFLWVCARAHVNTCTCIKSLLTVCVCVHAPCLSYQGGPVAGAWGES